MQSPVRRKHKVGIHSEYEHNIQSRLFWTRNGAFKFAMMYNRLTYEADLPMFATYQGKQP